MGARTFRRALFVAALFFGAGLVLMACSTSARRTAWATIRQDNGPMAPFEMAPGLYYIGASDVASYAIETSEGLIVIDGGYPSTAPRILENLRTLGFEPSEVRVLLNTHAHFDHAGGLHELKRATGAALYASAADGALLEAGGRGDFFLGDWMGYPPVGVDRVIGDGEAISLGGMTLTAHLTPGHTKGCTSWRFPIEVDGRVRQALLICGTSTLRYDLADNDKYPEIAADFSRTFATLRALPCEVFLSQHGDNFGLQDKRAAQTAGAATNPFVDPEGCRAYLDESEAAFRARLAVQQD